MIIFLYSPHYFSDSRCRLVSQLLARKLTFQITVAMRTANVIDIHGLMMREIIPLLQVLMKAKNPVSL